MILMQKERAEIIFVLLLFYIIANARLEQNDILYIHMQSIGSTKFKIRVNPEGPLGLIRAKISYDEGYLFNKRIFSSEIDIDYGLILNSEENFYIRNYGKDKTFVIHKNAGELEEYRRNYHNVLISMFSPVNDCLYIYPIEEKNDSFFIFLKNLKSPIHAYKILGSLLLLSEGMDILLTLEGQNQTEKTLVLLKKKDNNEGVEEDCTFNMNISLSIAENSNNSKKSKICVYQKETENIIQFFIDCKNSPLIQKEENMSEPTSLKELKRGKFLTSARWLIQLYIYEYIDTADQMMEFIRVVYNLVNKNRFYTKKNSDQERKETNIILKCFMFISSDAESDNLLNNIQYIKSYTSILNKPQEKVTPFSKEEHLSSYDSNNVFGKLPWRFLHMGKTTTNNSSEAALLALFCYFAFDPTTNTYSMDHIEPERSKLKNFFQKYRVPEKEISIQMMNDWVFLLRKTLDNSTLFLNEEIKISIAPGIVNMLYIILKLIGICNSKNDRNSRLNEILQKISLAHPVHCTDTIFLDIQEYLTYIFKQASRSCSYRPNSNENHKISEIEVEISWLKSILRNEQIDILGNITVKYTRDGVISLLKIEHLPRLIQFFILPEEKTVPNSVQAQLHKLKKQQPPPFTFTQCMIAYYIEKKELNFISSRYSLSAPIIQIKAISNTAQEFIAALFLYKKIESNWYKEEILAGILMRVIGITLSDENHIVRLCSNIFGSMALNKKNITTLPLACILYSKIYKHSLIHKKLKVESAHYFNAIEKIECRKLALIFRYIINTNSQYAILKWINTHLNTSKVVYTWSLSSIFSMISSLEIVVMTKCLTNNYANIDNIVSIVKNEKTNNLLIKPIHSNTKSTSSLLLIFIGALCQEGKCKGHIMNLFKMIDVCAEYGIIDCDLWSAEYHKNIITRLNSMKEYIYKNVPTMNADRFSKVLECYQNSACIYAR
ncbi:hypothetical protein NEPAR06_1449 [Nematocida parisii]|uniref:Uncharacterized protein n=1 Tax=Nematocida parisii (strain ERTm3) TaxID=935791 RepID=I3EEH3_NEMP3|nr:uncharacterized protein NEPG_02247 [Nematocida parisii ERTm1]EIJ87620.1 hypothetical protein NEQG_02167 [Nematocida parisii ERTm3]KAI5145086.1 hypothetical protein NEPAR07_1455 [Nematocida parisii]EIJ92848.1 hypothetical protein NEPG_02247 [Nematocida parisii ERTm1]KAI5154991.1 hypothetical protein NEPAR06_1449 [Nematocida parisii]KAI5157699.1 hypothetical protein NEPAR05_1509 [Nematocida parisii]|eukprot:XP_013060074.1 hypothetical protein NEPG_02247 [Nematocida parisii ERTm1]